MPPIDPTQLLPGFHGRFFWQDGSQMGECKTWEITTNVTTTDERVLDEPVSTPVWQGSGFGLHFTQLTISDRIPMQYLTAVRQKRQLWMRFVGEIYTDEGEIATYTIDRVTPDGNWRLFHAEVGTTMNRDFTWKTGALPDVPAPLRTNATGTA